jgi:protein required for attachment to host cells
MTSVRIPWQAWILVCDGAKALMLRNEGDDEMVNLKVAEAFEEPHPPSRDIGTDRPGRVQESATTGRSAMEETDWHQKAEAEFLADIAKQLDELVRKADIRHLIVVAPPKALGVLRDKFSKQVQAVIQAEIDKDLVNLPPYEIEKHLAA